MGRAEGYGPGEECAITVSGTGAGVLGPCAVFDTSPAVYSDDYVTLPGGAQRFGSECPVEAALAAGDALRWTSNGGYQGSVGCPSNFCSSGNDNGCAAKGTCGLPFSWDELGGGWELCFA